MTLVDTNVLLDLVTDDPVWSEWSMRQLDRASMRGPLAMNDVIYAELSVGFQTVETVDLIVAQMRMVIEPLRRAALFLAGKAFLQYRARGGARTGVMPDLFIGAQAAVMRWPVLTRDTRRYRSYFPTVELIAP